MFAFLKRMYLKVRNFFAINAAKCFCAARDIMVSGNRAGGFKGVMTWLGGAILMGAVVIGWFLGIYFITYAIAFAMMMVGGVAGVAIAAIISFFVMSDVNQTAIKFASTGHWL